jgi:hypothetical protein
MEFITVEWVWDSMCTIGGDYTDPVLLYTLRKGPFSCRRYSCPVPVRKSQSRQSFPVSVFELPIWERRNSLTAVEIKNFFKQYKIRSMPGWEQIAVMCTVP